MSFVATHRGRAFDLLTPSARAVDLDEIATALAQLCRWNGHTLVFYSVAEHSCRVADALPAPLAPYGLLHDAHEAYIGDLSSPLKRALVAATGDPEHAPIIAGALARLRDGIDEAIYAAAGLRWPLTPPDMARLHAADLALLATEKRDLMAPCERAWDPGADPLPSPIRPWSPAKAREEFRRRIGRLVPALRRAA